jgi:hypothetical protein
MIDLSMPTTPEEAPTAREIGICGTMTIYHSDVIRTALLEALAEADEVRRLILDIPHLLREVELEAL